MVKPQSIIKCPKCNKDYKSMAWFNKHREKCLSFVQVEKNEKKKNIKKIKNLKNINKQDIRSLEGLISADLLPNVFNFEDDYFNKKYFTPSFPNYLENLKNFSLNNIGLRIIHLNINSLFLKVNEIKEVISLGLYDIISLNETKLDETIPFSFLSDPNYIVLRRDRFRDGGGIIVLIKKNIKIIKTEISKNFEGISVGLLSGGKKVNILFSYKPPSLKNREYLDFVENFILSNNTNDHFLIVGDLNMDPSDEDSYFSSFLKNFNLISVTKEATRIGINTNKKGDTKVKISKIDHIICKDDLDPKSEVFGCPYSDHKFLVASFNFPLETKNEPIKSSRNYSEKNLNLLKNTLFRINFSEIDKFPNIDDKWGFVKDKVIEAIELCCPLKKFKNKNKDHSPWFDEELNSAKKYRDYCHHILMEEKNEENLIEYKNARREFKSLNRRKIKEYFENKTSYDFKNSKKFWNFYRSSIKIRSDLAFDDCPENIQYGEISANSAPEQVEMFNSFFSNVESSSFSTEDESSKYIFEKFKEFKRNNTFKTPGFSFKNFDLKEIEKSISELLNSSSPGYIGIHTKVLKAMPEIFSPILLKLFNSCLELKKIPEDWKIAIVTPLYKNKGDKTKIDNYRAISVLSPIAKMFEKLLAKQISDYFESNKIFFKGQHGFRTGFSCQTAIHEFISFINNALDQKLITLALFIDLRKAFDLIDSLILLLKLFHYGFDNNSLGLMTDYFNNRSQIVKLQNTLSKPGKLKYGVPQGSVFGPLLFLIFINDLPLCILKAFIELFADDTTLAKSGEKLDEILKDFEKIIEDLNEWCYFNKVDINWNKTFFMIFTKKKIEIPKKIEIKGASIDVVSEFRLLGFTIDDKLNFQKLVSEVCLSVNKKLFSIKRLFYLCTSVKIQFFKTFILPYFDYVFTLILYFSKEAIQRLANCFYLCIYKLLRISLNSSNFNELNNLLEKYGLFAFQHRALERMLTFSFKIINFANSPPLLKEQLAKNETRNLKYELRNKDRIIECGSRTKSGENTFKYIYSRLSNTFIVDKLVLKFSTFKLSMFNNINLIYEKSIKIFDKLNLNLKSFVF